MHKDSLSEEGGIGSSRLSSRGISAYYLGSAVFVIGIVLIILGSALIMLFQIHYGSEPEKILYTVVSIATGITMILIGINLMIRQTKKGYAVIIVSIIFSSFAIFLFITNYLDNFYYPLVSYVFGFYVIGFLALLGNAFANVIIWIIGNRPSYIEEKKEKTRLYTDEEIQRDIEEATKKSLEKAVAELQFDLEELPDDMVVGKYAPKTPGNIIRIKDDIDEVLNLSQTLTPGTTEKWGSVRIDKASMQLAKTISQPKKKKNWFKEFRERSVKKKSAKRARKAKKKKEIERKKQEKIEARKKEKELKKRKKEKEHNKKIEMKKAQKEAKIKEKKTRKQAKTLKKKKRLEAKKASKQKKGERKK